jgi:phosphatidylserine synthase
MLLFFIFTVWKISSCNKILLHKCSLLTCKMNFPLMPFKDYLSQRRMNETAKWEALEFLRKNICVCMCVCVCPRYCDFTNLWKNTHVNLKHCRRPAIISALNSTMIFVSQMYCADGKFWATWICWLRFITAHLRLLMLVSIQWLNWIKKNPLILNLWKFLGLQCISFWRNVLLKGKVLKTLWESLEKNRNSF